MAEEVQEESAKKWWGFSFLALGLLVVALDLSITDVAVPSIVKDLGISAADATLVVTVYMVVAASMMVTMGRVADLIGPRKAFLIGTVLFAVGSLITGLAGDLGVLLLGRAIQGLVVAIVIPASLSLLNHNFPGGRSRVLAFSLWTAVIGSAMALGPLIGGFLSAEFSWRWAFLINLPIVIVAAIGTRITISIVPADSKENGFDVVGSIFLVLGVASFTFGLQEATNLGWWTSESDTILGGTVPWNLAISATPILVGLGVFLLVVFVAIERSRARRGLGVVLEFQLFHVRNFTPGVLAAAFMTAGAFGLLLVIPWYAQYILDADPLGAGLMLAPLGLGMAIGGPIISRTTSPLRRTVVLMLLVQPVATTALVPFIGVDSQGWWLAPLLMIDGFAWGAAFSILVSMLLQDVPKPLSGVAGGTQTAARLLFGAIGGAILTSVLLGSVSVQMENVDESDLTAQERTQIAHLYQFSAQMHVPTTDPDGESVNEKRQDAAFAEVIEETKEDMVWGIRLAVLGAALFSLLGLFAGLRLKQSEEIEVGSPEGSEA